MISTYAVMSYALIFSETPSLFLYLLISPNASNNFSLLFGSGRPLNALKFNLFFSDYITFAVTSHHLAKFHVFARSVTPWNICCSLLVFDTSMIPLIWFLLTRLSSSSRHCRNEIDSQYTVIRQTTLPLLEAAHTN